MTQWILTYTVIFFALLWVIRELYESFKPKQKNSCTCNGCSCGKKTELLKNIKKKNQLSQI